MRAPLIEGLGSIPSGQLNCPSLLSLVSDYTRKNERLTFPSAGHRNSLYLFQSNFFACVLYAVINIISYQIRIQIAFTISRRIRIHGAPQISIDSSHCTLIVNEVNMDLAMPAA